MYAYMKLHILIALVNMYITLFESNILRIFYVPIWTSKVTPKIVFRLYNTLKHAIQYFL